MRVSEDDDDNLHDDDDDDDDDYNDCDEVLVGSHKMNTRKVLDKPIKTFKNKM